MTLQPIIHKNLKHVEGKANLSWNMVSNHGDYWLEHYWFWMGRRKYLLKRLLAAQLREFSRD